MKKDHNQLIGFKVYTAQRSLFRSLEVALKQYGITPGQFNLLSQLEGMGELSQKALADMTGKEQATITRYLDTLERKGLIVRHPDKNDRRAHLISVTSQARDLLESVGPATERAADALIVDIAQQDIDLFLATLEKLKQNAELFIERELAK